VERFGATQHGHFRDGRVVVGEFSTGRGRVRRKHPADDGRIRRRNDRQDERSAYATDASLRVYPKLRRRKSARDQVTTRGSTDPIFVRERAKGFPKT